MGSIKSLASATALGIFFASAAVAQDASTVLATVNGKEIKLGHMIALAERLPAQYDQIPAEELYAGILDQLIQQEMLSEQADRSATRYVLGRDNEDRAFSATIVLEKVSNDAVTDEALQALYDERYGALEPELEYRASHILVETEEEAQALSEEAAAGADFAELAKEHSTGPSGPSGGDLGYFVAERMVPAFSNAVAEMEVGAVSDPVQTQFGWHVIKLFETRDAPIPTLEEVQGELQEEIQDNAVQAYLADLEAGSSIDRPELDIDPELIRSYELLD